jgi:hypothetical protein
MTDSPYHIRHSAARLGHYTLHHVDAVGPVRPGHDEWGPGHDEWGPGHDGTGAGHDGKGPGRDEKREHRSTFGLAGLSRRAVLLIPLALAACGDDETVAPSPHDFPPLRYGYLPQIPLNMQRVEIAEGSLATSADGEIISLSPINVAETLYAMARDRLKPVAASGVATFRILNASIIRRRDTLNGVLAVRLEVRSDDGTSSGFAEARVMANHSGPISDQATAIYDMMKSMMDDMNVEFEYQLRNKLRPWIVDPTGAPPPPQPAPPPAPAAPQPLPDAPPQPPPDSAAGKPIPLHK